MTATEARSNLYRLIDETAESHQPIIIMVTRWFSNEVAWALALGALGGD